MSVSQCNNIIGENPWVLPAVQAAMNSSVKLFYLVPAQFTWGNVTGTDTDWYS